MILAAIVGAMLAGFVALVTIAARHEAQAIERRALPAESAGDKQSAVVQVKFVVDGW